MGLAGLVLPPVLVHLGLRAALLTDTIPVGLALQLFLASYREPAHVAPVPGRFSLPSRPESPSALRMAVSGRQRHPTRRLHPTAAIWRKEHEN